MKVYIAGPITGYEDGNRAAFRKAEAELILKGHVPVNPHTVKPQHDDDCYARKIGRHSALVDGHHSEHSYACHLRADIIALLDCEAITMLPEWTISRGATAEFAVANAMGMEVIDL